jgi:hypothetical protein
LLSSLFLEVSGTSLLRLHNTLVGWGVNPQTFDGSYSEDLLGPHGIHLADWNAYLGAQEQPLRNNLIGTVDFVLARQIMAIVLSQGNPASVPSESVIDTAAKSLVIQADNGCDVGYLVTFLQSSQAKYSTVPWGYEHLGDAGAIDSALSSL